MAAYRNLSKFRGEAKVSSWLHRIAVNQCLTTKRRARTRSEDFLDEDKHEEERFFVAPERLSPSRTIEANERLTLVRQAVTSLPSDLRQVIVMKEFEDMTFQEISETLEVPLSTVKSRLYTALKQLKMKLERVPLEIT
ncbi:MAG: RNA polymerase sigma factor [Acidobacteriota bacterium]